MGKPIIAQKRGKGSPTYRVPAHKFKPKLAYRKQSGLVIDIVGDSIRNSPLAKIRYMDGSMGYVVAVEGLKVGDRTDSVVMPLEKVAEGAQISNIESFPNSGPKLCRTPGSFAVIVSKGKKDCVIQLPSKKKMRVNSQCIAMVGIPAGEGRKEKPWIKAGKKWKAMHRRGKLYPRTSGVAMNAIDHPFGGGYSGLGKPKTVSRDTPPGRKVGSISPKKTGKKKR